MDDVAKLDFSHVNPVSGPIFVKGAQPGDVLAVELLRFLHLGRREALWRVIIPILAIAALVYTLYKNVWPRPPYPYDLFPLIVGSWLIAGAAITVLVPGFARRIGIALSEAEGVKGYEEGSGRT